MNICFGVWAALSMTAFGALDNALDTIVSIGREGQGNEAASESWKEVVKAGPSALLPILSATGKGSAVADNWLRLAANTIADQARTAAPITDLEAFLNNVKHPAPARQLAFDLIQQADPTKAEVIEPGLLHDPSQELRRGAVQRLIQEAKAAAEAKKEGAAKVAFEKAFEAARDEDQVKAIADGLEKLGEKPDIAQHFGFLMKWNIIGPFDNAKRAGFDTVYPPEKESKMEATYDGKSAPVKWQPFESKQEYGKVDFNKPFGMLKDSTAYASTIFNSDQDREAEIRLGCKNGWKVWLNGVLLFGRDEYHRGAQLDQYKLKCHLQSGANTILVKCCQNEQTEQWTVEWEFQLRVCDSTGTAIAEVKRDK